MFKNPFKTVPLPTPEDPETTNNFCSYYNYTMNKKAIYNFLKKLNTTKTTNGLADFVIENLTKLTKAQACWLVLLIIQQ